MQKEQKQKSGGRKPYAWPNAKHQKTNREAPGKKSAAFVKKEVDTDVLTGYRFQ